MEYSCRRVLKIGLENVLEKVHKKELLQDITQKSTTKSTGKNTKESASVREYSQRRAINSDSPRKVCHKSQKKHLLQNRRNQTYDK